MNSRSFPFCLSLPVLFCLAGCSGSGNPPTYPVTGVLTQAGKPLEGATIVFVPSDKEGEGASAKSGPGGKYEVSTFESNDGARPGNYKIKVMKYQVETGAAVDENSPGYNPDKQPPPPKNLLPPKFANQETSGITYQVPAKASTFDFDLK
jgi:hypothetical protein